MGKVKALMVEYAEIMRIDPNGIPASTSLTDMQRVVETRGQTVPLTETVTDWTGVEPIPDTGKTGVQSDLPPIPWVTLGSYVEVGLKAVNLKDYTIAINDQQRLSVTWEDYLVEISALRSSLSHQQLPIFQVKLFKNGFNPPLAMEFQKAYTGVACTCANLLNQFVIQRAIDQMETEWAQQETADNAAAELCDPERVLYDRGETIAEKQAQLNHETNPL